MKEDPWKLRYVLEKVESVFLLDLDELKWFK
jgi:hypothetical protein